MAVKFHGVDDISVGIKQYGSSKKCFVLIRIIGDDGKVVSTAIKHIDWMRLDKELETDRLIMEE